MRRYLVVGKTFQLAQEEGLAAQRRQFVQRQGQEVEALALVLEYLGGRLGHTLLLVEDVQGLGLAHPAAAMLVDREIERRPVQERPRMLDSRLTGAFQHAQIRVVSNVGRRLSVSEPGAEKAQQLPIMVFQDNSCSLPRERYP